jgi:type II secretory ATPase GspE/PulE/Tfp pilus assembly ATPase PilB-like protein
LGSRGIMADGISQVLAGLTTVEEILRVTQEG